MTLPALECTQQFVFDGETALVYAFLGVLLAHAAWDVAWGLVYALLRGLRAVARRYRANRAARLNRTVYVPPRPML